MQVRKIIKMKFVYIICSDANLSQCVNSTTFVVKHQTINVHANKNYKKCIAKNTSMRKSSNNIFNKMQNQSMQSKSIRFYINEAVT